MSLIAPLEFEVTVLDASDFNLRNNRGFRKRTIRNVLSVSFYRILSIRIS